MSKFGPNLNKILHTIIKTKYRGGNELLGGDLRFPSSFPVKYIFLTYRYQFFHLKLVNHIFNVQFQ